MAGNWFSGIAQTVAGGVATAATLGLSDDVNNWTKEGAQKVADSTDKTWGKDGEATKFVETMPVAGYVVSAGHGLAGDEQRARRAAATSTKSTLVTGGAIAGGLVAGPVGAAAGAAAGSAAGQCAEKGINHSIDKKYQTDAGTYNDFDGVQYTQDVIMDGALGGICSGATSTVGKQVSRAVVGESMKESGKNASRYVVKRGVEGVVSKAATAVYKPGVEKFVKNK